MKVTEKLCLLREQMKAKNISAYIVPSSDAHQSEYVAEYYKARQWVSNFSGSAGTIVVTLDDAGLWTDGRYYIQAEGQLEGSGIKLFRAADLNVPTYGQWLSQVLEKDCTVGFDGRLVDVKTVRELQNNFNAKGIRIESRYDLISNIWEDRPALPKEKIYIHRTEFTGKTCSMKLEETRKEMQSLGVNSFLLTSLDDIAWLLNLRGYDVPNNPVFIAYVIVTMEECNLYIDLEKIDEALKSALLRDGVNVLPYDSVITRLGELGEDDSIVFEPAKTSIALYNAISDKVRKLETMNITTKMKAIKNDVEIQNIKACMIQDGIALVKLIKWLKESVSKEIVTETYVDAMLLRLRAERQHFVMPSFDSIIGYRENAAMMHYKAIPETEKTLSNKGFLLVDSGGQYLNGTTDTTRTIALGELSEEEKIDFTLVLKGHIALGSAKFLYGATGSNLDVLARLPLWQQGIDYKCGTGHGIGFFLNVHEGPQRFAVIPNDIKLEKNMVITNEPGVYKEGRYGIRTENVLVVKEAQKTEFGQFMEFEDLTLCPIDLEGIVIEMLTEHEKEWLNNYHRKVFEQLSPLLSEEERIWLQKETRGI